MKRVKVLIALFACVTAIGVLLVMGLLAKMMELTAIAIQRAAIDLTNTARDWLRWAVEE